MNLFFSGRKRDRVHRFPVRPGMNRSAFILMEVLVSVAILAVGVTVLLQSIISSLESNRVAREYSRAIFLAESKMWEYEQKYAYRKDMETGEFFGDFEPPYQDYYWASEVESDEEAVEYRIVMTVKWMSLRSEKSFSLHTLVPMLRDEKDLL